MRPGESLLERVVIVVSKKSADKEKLLKRIEDNWLRAPIGSEREAECLKQSDAILRPELNAAKTAEEFRRVYRRAIKDSPIEDEAWQKWSRLDSIEKKKRGES